jgi:hypothetical protein
MLSFVERRNGFGAFYNDAPDALVCAENLLISFKNGQLYTHDNTTAYANLYGVQYYPSLNLIFNDQVLIKKTFDALGYQGNQIWESPFANDIITSQPNQQTGLPQISTLTVSDYITDEAIRKASFNRDINSMANPQVALWEGDYLKGGWINCNFTYRGSGFGWINSPYIKYSLSPKNL